MKTKIKFPIPFVIALITGTLFGSCIFNMIPDDKFRWEAGISAPKYYPISNSRVDLQHSGYGSITNFDNGWGMRYGAVLPGEKYKNLPRQAYIRYNSAVENFKYEDTIVLPYDKILGLFKKYSRNKENDIGHLVVGMAPGGWVRIWAVFVHDELVKIEVLNTKIKGQVDRAGNDFEFKKSAYWKKYKTYWNHFGIPYEVWKESEPEYDVLFDFGKPNPAFDVFDVQYSSLDGTIYYNAVNDETMSNRKLPADIIMAWRKKEDSISFDTHILLPKGFLEKIRSTQPKLVTFSLEIEPENYGKLYLRIDNKERIKVLRFKNEPATSNYVGSSNFCKEVTYF